MSARVIGLGRPAAGDETVGIAVLRDLREQVSPEKAELIEAADPASLLSLLENADVVVLVDAVFGSAPGEVRRMDPETLRREGVQTASSSGVALSQVIERARSLSPESVAPEILIVGVSVEGRPEPGVALSADVAEAVPRAAKEVLSILGGEPCTKHPGRDES